jgi:hypothetical protein
VADFDGVIAHERAISASLDGRTAMRRGPAKNSRTASDRGQQLSLFS